MPRSDQNFAPLLAFLRPREHAMVRMLRDFVRIESHSDDKPGIDRLGRKVATEWRRRGAHVRILRRRQRGNHIRAELWPGRGRPAGQILVLGHLDTVYPRGTLNHMPFRIARGCAWGPGAFDMKGGLVLALFAADSLRALRFLPRKRFVFLWTSDEEIGSGSSRETIEREARRSDAVLVLEPAFGLEGRLKTQRKGGGAVELTVLGRAAHAGINPEAGVNAVHELAFQIERVMRLNNPRRGISVQATVIEGGVATNVVPAHAETKLDVRYPRSADSRQLASRLRRLRPVLPGARLEVRVDLSRPPLERSAAVRSLFRKARLLARHFGTDLGEVFTGGGSDGNFTAALGVPTLDGLGAVGEGAHSLEERVVIRKLPERAALIAALLATL